MCRLNSKPTNEHNPVCSLYPPMRLSYLCFSQSKATQRLQDAGSVIKMASGIRHQSKADT
jgi:hypothetical protein